MKRDHSVIFETASKYLGLPFPCSITEPWHKKLFFSLSTWGKILLIPQGRVQMTFLWNFPQLLQIRVSLSLLLLAIILCQNFLSSLSLSHVIISLGRERCFLAHLSYYSYPNAAHILGPWSGLRYAQFSKTAIWLMYNIMCISGVLHSDLTFAYIMKWSWH